MLDNALVSVDFQVFEEISTHCIEVRIGRKIQIRAVREEIIG